jgi:hypothetical protein
MGNFCTGWILPLVEQHFDMIEYDPAATYSRDYAVIATYQQDFEAEPWYSELEQSGHKIILDHLFDSDVDTRSFKIHPTKLDLRNGHWSWYHYALLALHYGYDSYQPQPQYTHDFLCLMNKQREHRDRVMQDLQPELESAIWSYVERGYDIQDPAQQSAVMYWPYYNNPEWYNKTPWSLVVESYMRGDPWFAAPSYPNYRTEISEKTYKPLAFYHPFIVVGSEGTLRWIKSEGFETWDNLWDESYDTVANDAARLDATLAQSRDAILHYNSKSPKWDLITELKLKHNHSHFYNPGLISQRFESEIVHDILEFLS